MAAVGQQAWITPIEIPVVTAGGYSANDVVGGLLTFDIKGSRGAGQLQRILLEDGSNQKPALDVWIFDTAPTGNQLVADNGAFYSVITLATIRSRLAFRQILTTDWTTTNSLAHVEHQMSPIIPFYSTTGNLFVYFVCTGTPTLTALCFSARLGVLLD